MGPGVAINPAESSKRRNGGKSHPCDAARNWHDLRVGSGSPPEARRVGSVSPPHARRIGADGRELFSRAQACRFLGLTLNQLRYVQKSGRLQPITIEGTHLFPRAELERYRAQEPGQLAARAFAAFEAGKSATEAVIDLKAEPRAIADLHAAWIEMSGAWVVAGPRGSRRAWEATYQIGPLTAIKLRRALELCAASPELRAQLKATDAATLHAV